MSHPWNGRDHPEGHPRKYEKVIKNQISYEEHKERLLDSPTSHPTFI